MIESLSQHQKRKKPNFRSKMGLSLVVVEWNQNEEALGHKKSHPKKSGLLKGGAEWIRTTDSRIFSPMLYQLSYSTKFWVGKTRYFFEKAKYKLKFVEDFFKVLWNISLKSYLY